MSTAPRAESEKWRVFSSGTRGLFNTVLPERAAGLRTKAWWDSLSLVETALRARYGGNPDKDRWDANGAPPAASTPCLP